MAFSDLETTNHFIVKSVLFTVFARGSGEEEGYPVSTVVAGYTEQGKATFSSSAKAKGQVAHEVAEVSWWLKHAVRTVHACSGHSSCIMLMLCKSVHCRGAEFDALLP